MSDGDHPSTGKVYAIRPDEALNPRGAPKATPCSTCVLRRSCTDTTPFGFEEADELYTDQMRSQYWIGTYDAENPSSAMRNGGLNACHQGHRNPCVASLVCEQRELLRWHSGSHNAARGSLALSQEGIERIGTRLLNDGCRWDGDPVPLGLLHHVPYRRLLEHAHQAIGEPDIGHPDLAPPEPGEFDPPASEPRRGLDVSLKSDPFDVLAVGGADGIELREVTRNALGSTFWIYHTASRVGSCVIRTRRTGVELRLSLNPSDRGQGIGSEATRLLVTVATAFGHKRLRANVPHNNAAALHIVKALGFREIPSKRPGVVLERG